MARSSRKASSTNQWNTVGTVPRPLARAATKRFSMANEIEVRSETRFQSSACSSPGGKTGRGTTTATTHTGTWT